VLASTALALLLSQTSARFAWNLPVAVAVVWATHALARVRVDARWDTGTRRLHVSVTRQRARDAPGTHADAPGASRAFSRRDADAPLAGSDAAHAASEPEGTSACSSEPSQSRDAADGARLNSPTATKRVGSRTAACSAYSSPLRDALRERETNGEWNDARAYASEEGLLGSWARLRDRVVREFVTDLWYAPITPDAQFPNAVSRVLDVAFAELARRARRADLAELLLETAPAIVAENLERFRRAREVVGGVDAYVRRTPREADAEMAPTLWPRELFGDASLEEIRPLSKALSRERSSRVATSTSTSTFEEARGVASREDAIASAEPSPLLAAFEKHAHRVLSARCVAVADALLRETELSSPPRAPDPLLRPLARELLVGCLLRPLLGFCSPAWAHRGLAAMLAAEDDVAAAGGEAPEGDAPREGTEPTLLSARGGSAEVPETPETLFEEKEKKKDSEDSSSRVFVAARVAEAHIAGKGASAYAVYAVRVRARTRASGDKETETETEWVVPRRFRNFEALHRRCEKEASLRETARRSDLGSVDASASASASDSPDAFAPMPSLPKKRFALNSLDGAFVEARRAALDEYLTALVSCPARAARSAALDAFFDPATVAGPFAPEPDRNALHALNAFASPLGLSLSSVSRTTSVADAVATSVGGLGAGERPESVSGGVAARAPRRRPPAVPRAESSSTSAIGTNTAPASERTPRSSLSHRRAASSGAIPGAFFVADGPVAAAAPKEAAPKERAAPPRARCSFPDLASATFSSNTDDVTARDRDVSEVTAVDSLARGGLLRLFESVFHLRAKGVVRRTVVALARQTLEFFAGAAVEDLAAAKLRALRSPETAKAAVDLIERALWPGGVWHRTAQARARAADNPGGAAGTGDVAALAGPFSEVEAARAEEERVRLKVRDALLASWSRGPLYNLVGARNCTRAGLDVLGVARSELLCARVGLEAMLAALDAAFPESAVARRDETAYL
jgi:sorting nexin-13